MNTSWPDTLLVDLHRARRTDPSFASFNAAQGRAFFKELTGEITKAVERFNANTPTSSHLATFAPRAEGFEVFPAQSRDHILVLDLDPQTGGILVSATYRGDIKTSRTVRVSGPADAQMVEIDQKPVNSELLLTLLLSATVRGWFGLEPELTK